MYKKIVLSSILATTLLSGASFEFNSIKKDASGDIRDKGLKVADEKVIIATGYGVNEQKAKQSAFVAAIEQYVGVVVDSETIVQNGKLIEDNILTASNGFIKTYEVLSTKAEDGLVEIKIKATVKSQKLFNKIKSLNITTITIDNAKDAAARITTKLKSKKDAAKILRKTVGEFFSTSSMQEMLKLEITGVKVQEDKVKNDRVPIEIKYSMSLDYDVYIQKIKKMEKVFKNLGAKLHKRVDLPYFGGNNNEELAIKNVAKVNKLTSTDFGIIKKYGQGYKLDVWEFPKSWKDIYPFNVSGVYDWKNIFQVILEIKDNDGEVLIASNINESAKGYTNLLLSGIYYNQYRNYSQYKNAQTNGVKLLTPMFTEHSYMNNLYKNITIQYVNLKNIEKIKNITIELEEK